MMRPVLSFCLVLLILAGCARVHDPEHDNDRAIVADSPDHAEEVTSTTDPNTTTTDPASDENGTDAAAEESPDVRAALAEVEALLEAVQARDTDRLVELLDYTMQYIGTRMDHETAEIIIEGFTTNYDLDSLKLTVNKERLVRGSGVYEFKLSDNWGDDRFEPWSDEDRFVILYEENGTRFYNPYIRYFPFAGEMVSRYMELVQSEDAEGLAVFLNPDDLEVPVWVAEETISKYKEFLKGEAPAIRYVNRFFFVVDNGHGEEHTIQVDYGDSLMGIRDAFIPEF